MAKVKVFVHAPNDDADADSRAMTLALAPGLLKIELLNYVNRGINLWYNENPENLITQRIYCGHFFLLFIAYMYYDWCLNEMDKTHEYHRPSSLNNAKLDCWIKVVHG